MSSTTCQGAGAYLPLDATLPQLRIAVQKCQGCDLYRNATQAVFGEGLTESPIVMVGEQPGDKEDLAGKPFVGPAGDLLTRALLDARIPRSDLYITNAVKHFKFEERGKRRIHKKPSSTEIVACRPWLDAELALLHPLIIVCLGATALQSVLGPEYRVLRDRGKFFDHPAARAATVTVHPSSILRAPRPDAQRLEYEAFVRDLRAVRRKFVSLAKSAVAKSNLSSRAG